MDEKEKRTMINVWGIANIGCTMENPTFQTIMVDENQQNVEAAEMVEVASENVEGEQMENTFPDSPLDTIFHRALNLAEAKKRRR